MTRSFGMCSLSSAAARSRSISTATTCPARAARGRVSAPRPGPISRKVSSSVGGRSRRRPWRPRRVRGSAAPNRFRGLGDLTRSAPRLLIILAAPVTFLDFLNLLFAQPEVVTDFMNQRFSDDRTDVIIVLAVLLDRLLKNRDAVRKGVAVGPRTLGQRRSLIEAVQRVGRLDLISSSRSALGSSSTTTAILRISRRKRLGISVIASATSRSNFGRVTCCAVCHP
jgi:hypothetical protein